MGGFAQDMDNPKQMKYLMLDVLSRMASHTPGALLGYYQYGVAYGLLGPLAALALWDAGTSVGNYLRPEVVAPDSPSQGYLIDALGAAYQGMYGIKLISLGVMRAYSENAWDNAVLSDGNWRLVEFSDISNLPSVSEITNDDFQYFVTVAGNSRYYLLLGAELQAVESDGKMTNTLVYLSHFGSPQRESSLVTLPIEFDKREDLLSFAESLAYVFGESRKRTLLFRVESLND